jgi:triosephosphate isomerase
MQRKPWIGGNWKCNLTSSGVEALVKILNEGDLPPKEALDIVVAPAHIWLPTVKASAKDRFTVAAQDCNQFGMGAYTGSHSAEMLLDAGIKDVIIGHSERRSIFHESDEEVGAKVKKALGAGMNVIACLGEQKEDRVSGKTEEVIFRQIAAIAANVANVADWDRVVIAYEPVWAIGTGLVATPQQAQDAHAALRKWLKEKVSAEVAEKVRIAYGGSVAASNSAELAKNPDVDGFLVGGASLKPDFITICTNLAEQKKSA